MGQKFFEIMEQLAPTLRRGDLDACEQGVVDQLRSLPESPFHCAIDLAISNSPDAAARHVDHFVATEAKRFTIAAAYTEMNGFYINPDRWYCDFFAYSSYGGHDDYDWLADWQSDGYDEFEINGLETLQQVYASDAYGKDEYDDASDLTSLLVVIRFQQFIHRAAPMMKQLRFPLLSTAHDFDFIAEFSENA